MFLYRISDFLKSNQCSISKSEYFDPITIERKRFFEKEYLRKELSLEILENF